MPYTYLDDVALSDAAFTAWADTLDELFETAAEAALNEMVENPQAIRNLEHRIIRLGPETLELLLHDFLQEFIYYKDSDQLLLRPSKVRIEETDEGFTLQAQALGERLDPERHRLAADVKAVTMHKFRIERTEEGWEATVVLDI